MSYRRHMDEQRNTLIDHRMRGIRGPGMPLDPDQAEPEEPSRSSSRGLLGRARNGSPGYQIRRRYRHVRPAFTPMPFSDLLPYEDPMERAIRWNS